MPQTPSSSPLCQLWIDPLQKHVPVTSGNPVHWPAQVHALHGHTNSVRSVAYLPNGAHIVSGSEDMTIRVWDETTGQCVAGPFEGHTDCVESVVYLPDGNYIVSGSWDGIIRVWNATTGQCVVGPFEGHTRWIASITYSPDGHHIVTGSGDFSIKVRKAQELVSFGRLYVKHNWIQFSDDTLYGWIAP